MGKIDKRTILTRQKIIEAFIELVEQRGYNNINVSDITRKAELNRNTFYLHFQDKESIVKTLIAEEAEKLNQDLKLSNNLYKVSLYDVNETEIRWLFRKIAKRLAPNMELYRILLLDSSLNGYMEGLSKVMKKNLSDILRVQNPQSNLVFEYAFNGMYGLIKQWIIYSPTSDAKTAKILAKLAYSNLKQFKEIN